MKKIYGKQKGYTPIILILSGLFLGLAPTITVLYTGVLALGSLTALISVGILEIIAGIIIGYGSISREGRETENALIFDTLTLAAPSSVVLYAMCFLLDFFLHFHL